jgi:4-amino-4-deoxy-L-arabinose transferase-like glycosyltransferase
MRSITWRDPVTRLVALIVGLAVLRAMVAGSSLLSGDEAYYWLWSRRIQLSYFDHPGMSAWWMALSTGLFGDGELAIRLPAILAGALVSGLVFLIARSAFGDAWTALVAVVWLNATVLFGAGAVTATPDVPLLVFWSAGLYALMRMLDEDGNARWVYGLGAALGLGFISKYTMVLIAPGVLLVLILFPQGRRWWRSPHTYLAILLAAACTSPVVAWNAMNDWASFKKQLSHSFDTPVADPLAGMATYLATQLGVVTPLILGFAAWGMGWALWAGYRSRRPQWFALGACSAPVLAFFIHHSLSGLVQPHWAGPAYLGGIVAAVGGWRSGSRGRLDRLFRAAPWLGAAMIGLVYLHAATAILPIPTRADSLSRLGGWDRLAAAVQAQRQTHPEAFIFVQKHEVSGLLTYYLPDHPKVFLTGSAGIPRIPSYDAGDVARLAGRDGLFVTRASIQGVRDMSRYFDRVELLDSLDRGWGGRVVDRYEIWLGETYRSGTFEDAQRQGQSK